MNRIILLSRDIGLEPVLGSALGRDYELTCAHDAEQILRIADTSQIDTVVLDVDSSVSSHDVYVQVNRECAARGISVVLLADDNTRSLAVDLVQAGAHSYCRKPPALRELKTALQRACELTHMKRNLSSRQTALRAPEQPASRYDGLVGTSAPMRHVCALISRVANLNASVLITGESGTGKELVARAIHNLGSRKNQPFVAVSCGAIPETLIESELFGHEKGAFTGSTGTHCGYFEQAGGGTLFLDEIGELSPQTQVKLLRVLQQREFSRLGSSRTIPLKARLIFATHRNLSRMVAQGSFRLDLFYRVNVTKIHSPTLSERKDDIAALSAHFLKIYSEMYNKYVDSMSRAALEILERYDWPGNIRELENVIQSAIIQAESNEILPADLPEVVRSPEGQVDDIDVIQAGTFERMLRDYKVRLAMRALEEHQGNKTLAARSLDISRAYLYRLLNQQEETQNVA